MKITNAVNANTMQNQVYKFYSKDNKKENISEAATCMPTIFLDL